MIIKKLNRITAIILFCGTFTIISSTALCAGRSSGNSTTSDKVDVGWRVAFLVY